MSVDVGSEARVAQPRKQRSVALDGASAAAIAAKSYMYCTLDSGLFTECSKAQSSFYSR